MHPRSDSCERHATHTNERPMKLHLNDSDKLLRVSAYDEGSVTVGEQRITRTFAITPSSLITDVSPIAVESLTWDTIAALHEIELEILVLGTGTHQQFPPPTFYSELAAEHIGLEVMDSAAACRTFNILAMEGRRVAALILL